MKSKAVQNTIVATVLGRRGLVWPTPPIYSDTVKQLVFVVPAPNAASAVRRARESAYGRGYIGTHLRSVRDFAGPNATGDPLFLVTLDLDQRRVRSPILESGRFSRGMKVRTRAPGFSHVGGQSHSWPPGSVGTVWGRLGDSVLVRFPEIPGRGFLYSPTDLEIIGDAS
jgi:hypothetical protein